MINDRSNRNLVEAGAKHIADIAAKARDAMDDLHRGKLSEPDMTALYEAEEFFAEAVSGVEAIDSFTRRNTLSCFWNLNDIQALAAATWYLAVRKHLERRPNVVHEIVHEVRAWCALLHKAEYNDSLNESEAEDSEMLRDFFAGAALYAERIARGETLPLIKPETLEPVEVA